MTWWQRILRSLAPAVANPPVTEMLRAALGTGLALVICVQLVRWAFPLVGGTEASIFLISPLAATAFLAFAVPSSPLAQPWSALVGNTVSALVGVAVVLADFPVGLALGLSVTVAMAAMMTLRALHPPAAGVALGTVLTADLVREIGFSYAFLPVFVDTALLLLLATLYNRATGRRYPFRQVPVHVPQVGDVAGLRPTLAAPALNGLLQTLRLDANIGAADLSRLIDAAHREAAVHLFDGVEAAAIMTSDLITIPEDMPLPEVATLLAEHHVRSLPVISANGAYLGLIGESDILRHMQGSGPAEPGLLGRWFRPAREDEVIPAKAAARRDLGTATPSTPLGPLIDLLASRGQQSVPVLDQGRIVGIVSRSDLILALAKDHRVEAAPEQE